MKKRRVLTLANAVEKKHKTYKFEGIWGDVFGETEINGGWIVFGKEKNGKTWFSLLLAEYLSNYNKVLYVSAEEGIGRNFTESIKRAKLDITNKKIHLLEYLPISELRTKLKRQRSEHIIIIDNLTIYKDVIKSSTIDNLLRDFPRKLFIFISHEDKNEPDLAIGTHVKKLAKVIIQVKGLTANVGGRVPGGTLTIDETKAKIFHGNNI